jgi:hypothetical protein
MFAPKQGAKVGDRYIAEFSPTGVTRFETVKSPEEAERQRRGQLISELKNHLLGLRRFKTRCIARKNGSRATNTSRVRKK